MGTSSGAYAGSLFCAGYKAEDIVDELCCIPPIQLLRPNWRFWRGLFLLDQVVRRLYEVLPPTFESLDKEFAVGVINANGEHQCIDSGPLPEAVAASGAIPLLFAPVHIPEAEPGPFLDGGFKDRTGLQLWRNRRNNKQKSSRNFKVPDVLVHLIERSSPFSGTEDIQSIGEKRVSIIHTSKSKRNFFTLGNYQKEMYEAYELLSPSVNNATERIKRKIKI